MRAVIRRENEFIALKIMPTLTYAFDDSLLLESNESKYYRDPDANFYYSFGYHNYILPNKGVNPEGTQQIFFIHGLNTDKPELEYVEGISDEQLLEVLIHRSQYFQTVLPCEENVIALDHLKAALQAKLDRTAKRQVAGVEGTNQAH